MVVQVLAPDYVVKYAPVLADMNVEVVQNFVLIVVEIHVLLIVRTTVPDVDRLVLVNAPTVLEHVREIVQAALEHVPVNVRAVPVAPAHVRQHALTIALEVVKEHVKPPVQQHAQMIV